MTTNATITISIGPKTIAHKVADASASAFKLRRLTRQSPTLKCIVPELTNICLSLAESQDLYGAIGYEVLGFSRWALAVSDVLDESMDVLWRIEKLFGDYQIELATQESLPKGWNDNEIGACIKKVEKCSETLMRLYVKLESRYLPPPLNSTIQRIVRTAVAKQTGPLVAFSFYDEIRESFFSWCKSNGISSEYLDANKAELNKMLVDAIHQHRSPNLPAADQSSIYLLPTTTPERAPSQWTRSLNVFSRIKRRASSGNLVEGSSEAAPSPPPKERKSFNIGPVSEIKKKLALGQPLTKEEELFNAAQSCERGDERHKLLIQYLQLQAATGDLGSRDMDLISLFEK